MTLQSLLPQGNSSLTKKDFDNLIQENLPSWSATWNMLLQANLESSKVGKRTRKKTDLHERIWRKITELVNEEEALIDLYTKAAEAAKEREMKFRSKSAILTEQLKKERNLIKMLSQMG